ncbi:hypothetical protein Btru_004968 [Bulinus truncatus]|nr:hypothetical protein Btru_004968 [Bulinus truncatus]
MYICLGPPNLPLLRAAENLRTAQLTAVRTASSPKPSLIERTTMAYGATRSVDITKMAIEDRDTADCQSQNRIVCNMIYFKSNVMDYNWFAASEYCQSMGAGLAVVDSSDVNDFFVFNFRSDPEVFWLGASGYGHELSWVDGSYVQDGFQNWASNESPHMGNDYHCLSANGTLKEWHSSHCNLISAKAFCQKCIDLSAQLANCTLVCICKNTMTCVAAVAACSTGCQLALLSSETNLFCPSSRYGRNCGMQCFCANGAPCDHSSGACPGPCQIGWVGSRCDNTVCIQHQWGPNCEFSCYCKNELQCSQATGKCVTGCTSGVGGASCNVSSTCPPNKWDEDCSKSCYCAGGGHCNSKTGHCLESSVGCKYEFTGPGCNILHPTSCPAQRWGHNCERSCFCKNDAYCYRFNGACEYGCVPGVVGLSCNESLPICPLNRWGPNCHYACHCAESRQCRSDTGVCLTFNHKCDPGWHGLSCNLTDCPLRYFGTNCTEVCYCGDNNQCTVDHGMCPDGNCLFGWSGPSCNRSDCEENFFGQDCQETCKCPADEFCNRQTGNCLFPNKETKASSKFSIGCCSYMAIPYVFTFLSNLLLYLVNIKLLLM